MVRGVVGSLFLCCAALAVGSASNAPSLTTYVERTWQVQDGLPEQTVQAFAQTKDRYLWIGTTGGLLRFDGARLVCSTAITLPHLPKTTFSTSWSRATTLCGSQPREAG